MKTNQPKNFNGNNLKLHKAADLGVDAQREKQYQYVCYLLKNQKHFLMEL